MVYLPWYNHGYTGTIVNEPWLYHDWTIGKWTMVDNGSTTVVQPKYNHGSQHQHNINCCLSAEVVIIYDRIVIYYSMQLPRPIA